MADFEIRIKDGVKTWTPETVPGSQVFDGTPTTTPPAGAIVRHLATRVGKPVTMSSAKRTFTLSQFGNTPSPALYKLSCDFRDASISHAQWEQYGAGMFSQWTSDQADGSNPFSAVPDSKKFVYQTESSLHGPLEGHGYWMATPEEIERNYMQRINAWGPGVRWVANIETSNNWERQAYSGGGYTGWGSRWGAWDEVKNQTIRCVSNGQTMTLEYLMNSGYLPVERAARKQLNNAIMLQVAARGGALPAHGSAAYQGEPRTDALSTSGRFLDEGSINVDHIGGSNGVVTLNGTTYRNMTGSWYKFEKFHLDYHYYFSFLYNGQLVDQSVFENNSHPYNSETSYPALYAKCTNRHPVAREMGHWLANRKRLREVHDGQDIPTGRMTEMFYEDNFSRTPYSMGLAPWQDGAPPKVWIIPYVMRIMRIVHHFLEGERAGSFFHIFHAQGAPNQGIIYNLSSINYYNHEFHTLNALFGAGRDMETILDKMAGSTLTTDLEVKFNVSGSWQLVNGVSAYGLDPGGGYGPMTPCFATRHLTTSEGLSVLICGGMDQSWDTTRTDLIRIPGVGNGCMIQLEYKGPDVQLFECVFPNGVSNQVIQAKSIVPAWIKPGYGGWINQ